MGEYSSEFMAELKRLGDLDAEGDSPEGKVAADRELDSFTPERLYQIAANAGENRNDAVMGDIEKLLRKGDRAGLRERLGKAKSAALEDAYLKAAKQEYQDRSSKRTWTEAAVDAPVAMTDSVTGMFLGGLTLGAQVIPGNPENIPFKDGKALQGFHEAFSPLYSDAVAAHQRVKDAKVAGLERENLAEWEASQSVMASPEGKTDEWVANQKYNWSNLAAGVQNSANDPILASKALVEGITSMGQAALVKGGFETAGKFVIGKAAARLEAKALLAGSEDVAGKIAADLGSKFATKLETAAVSAATGVTEGVGAYSQTLVDIMSRDPEDLYATSKPFQDLVAEVRLENQQKNLGLTPVQIWKRAQQALAQRTALTTAAGTGLASAAIGALLPEGLADPLRVVSKGKTLLGAYGKDVLKETAEEGLQGGAGALIGNLAKQAFIDPNQNLAEGVGSQMGEGAILGGLVAGTLKGPSAVTGVGSLGVDGAKFLADLGSSRKLAELEKSGPVSAEKLSSYATELYENKTTDRKMVEMAMRSLDEAGSSKEDRQAAGKDLTDLLRSPVVQDMPASVKTLSAENRKKFMPASGEKMNRVDAIYQASKLLNESKDEAEKGKLASVLNELVEPIERFRSLPSSFSELMKNDEAAGIISTYQTMLGNIETIPQVKAAIEAMPDLLGKFLESGETSESLVQAKAMAGQAKMDLSLPGKTAKEVETFLAAHSTATNAGPGLSEEQRRLLEGSLILLRAREELEKSKTSDNQAAVDEMMSRHKLGDRSPDSVGRQATVEEDMQNLENGKFSAKQHISRIVGSMSSGKLKKAAKQLARLGKFAMNQKNKVQAINTSFQNGGTDEVYQQLDPVSGEFRPSTENPRKENKYKYAFVNLQGPGAAASLRHAREVNQEAKLLVKLYNGAVEAFPELKMELMEEAELASALNGELVEVSGRFIEQRKMAKAPKSESTEQVPNKSEPVEPAETPEVVRERNREDDAEYRAEAEAQSAGQESIRDRGIEDPKVVSPTETPEVVRERNQKSDAEYRAEAEAQSAGQESIRDRGIEDRRVQSTSESVNPSEQLALPLGPTKAQILPVATPKPPPAKPKTLAEAYPRLAQITNKVKGYFHQVFEFSLNKDGSHRSRLVGLDQSPSDFLMDATSSQTGLNEILGKDGNGQQIQSQSLVSSEVSAGYAQLLDTPVDALDNARKWMTEWFKRNGKLLNRKDENGEKVSLTREEQDRPELPEDMQNVGGIAAFMQVNLEQFLASEWSNGGTVEQGLRNGSIQITGMSNGKPINMVELNPSTNKFQYNPDLLMQGAVAALQWHIQASSRVKRVFDETMAETLGVDVSEIDMETQTKLSEGESLAEAKNSLAQTLRRFWGVKINKTEGLGFTDGIPEAMAAEFMRAMENVDLLTVKRVSYEIPIYDEDGIVASTKEKTQDRYIAQELPWSEGEEEVQHPVYQYPGLLEEASIINPERKSFWGTATETDKIPVAETQLSNTNVALTDKLKRAVRNMQRQKFYLNMPMMQAVLSMGVEDVVKLFGYDLPVNPELSMNKMDLEAKLSTNLQIHGAFRELERLVSEMQLVAQKKGLKIEELGKQYQYAVTSVNRIMMLGSHNPQASKLMREIMMPTWSTLDTTEGSKGHQHMLLAVAQALGRKIHTFSLAQNTEWMNGQISGNLRPVLDRLFDYNEELLVNPGAVFPVMAFRDLMAAAGTEITPIAMMALKEVARWEAAGEGQKTFRTPLYLEADGMTNGPFNAMGLLATGDFDANQLRNWARGGLNVSEKPIPAHESSAAVGGKDLYTVGMDSAQSAILKLFNDFRSNPEDANIAELSTHLFGLMEILLEGEVSWIRNEDGTNELKLTRKFGKNPITVLIYGSGVGGVASKVLGNMMNSFQEKMSIMAAADAKSESRAQRMFPKDSPEVAKQKMESFLTAAQALATYRVSMDEETGQYSLSSVDSNLGQRVNEDPHNFEFEMSEISNMKENLRYLVVAPMYKGIQEALGTSIFKSTKLLVNATKVQSNIARVMFYKAIERKLAEKTATKTKEIGEKAARSAVSNEFLSRQELSDAFDEVATLMPMVSIDDQNFLIAKNKLLEFFDNQTGKTKMSFRYSRSLDDRMRTAPFVRAVADAGVSAVPYLTIGMGDGRMVREIFQTAFENSMQVYDGVNIALENIDEYSQTVNASALHAWQGNVFKSLSDSYQGMIKDPRVKAALYHDPDFVRAISKAMYGKFVSKDMKSAAGLAAARKRLEKSMWKAHYGLAEAAIDMQARRIALATVPISMDQMSGTYKPHVSPGGQRFFRIPEGMTFEQKASLLSVEYQKARASLMKSWIEPAPRKVPRPAKKSVPVTAQPEQFVEPVQQEFLFPTRPVLEERPDAPVEVEALEPVEKSEVDDELDSEPVIPVPESKPLDIVEEPKGAGQQPLPAQVFRLATGRHESGALVLSKAELPNLVKDLKDSLTPTERSILSEILSPKSKTLDGVKIVTGTHEEIVKFQELEGRTSLDSYVKQNPGKQVFGLYAPGERTLYLMSPKVETFVHELIHASTLETVRAHYNGKLADGPAKDAILRLESLMKAFLSSNHNLPITTSTGMALQNAKNAINEHRPVVGVQTKDQKALALNEFMAWTLTNRDLAEKLELEITGQDNQLEVEQYLKGQEDLIKSEPRSLPARLLKIVQAAWNAIKTLIGKNRTMPAGLARGTDMLSNIQFNTASVIQNAVSMEQVINDLSLAHSILTGNTGPTRLNTVLEAFGRQIARHLGQIYTADWLRDLPQNTTLTKPLEIADKLAEEAATHFHMEPIERATFHMMVLALATEAKINPHSMTEASKIYDQFLQTSKAKEFLKDQSTTDPNAIKHANEQFAFLTGRGMNFEDKQKRSTVLPVFLALATVNEEVRNVLSQKKMPGDPKTVLSGMDTALEAAGSAGLRTLEKRLSGSDHSTDLKQGLDLLMQRITKQALQAHTVADNLLEVMRSTGHGVNAKMVSLLKISGKKAERTADSLSQSSNKFNQTLASVLRAVAFSSNDQSAGSVGEHWLEQQDKWQGMPNWAREFLGSDGLMGRVVSQAKIYDMFKKVRATVAQTRQAYRRHVPAVIDAKFKFVKPDAKTYDMLYRFMGRSDMTSLLQSGRTIQDVLALVTDKNNRDQEILKLQVELAALQKDPTHVQQYNWKIKQLVEFMHTGVYGTNLLRNAYAISRLLGVDRDEKTWMIPTERTVQVIDQLVTLKYLEGISEYEQTQFTQLHKDETEAIEFTLNYLKGQRAGEVTKATQGKARLNHYKGHLPFETNRGHLVVADDGDAAKMALLGYEHAGSYVGSKIDNQSKSRSYYFSPEGGARTQFNQGLIQNVQGTAYGVHTETGLSMGANAGLITDPDLVEELADKLEDEFLSSGKYGSENLSPIYDEMGKVIAFERTLDPKKVAKLKTDQHLGKMIGHWRGRQVEEKWAKDLNEEVLNRLVEMYEKDKGGPNEDRYVNLFDKSNSPVIKDAVSILPTEVRDVLEERFGKGKFLVRRNLVNQIVGYRNASIGDMWTGNSNISKETQDTVRKILISMPGLGTNAYRKLVWAERNWQAVTSSMRTNIVVRSLTVSVANIISGLYQLKARGVPIASIVRGLPKKLAEIEYYTKTMAKKIDLEAELHAADGDAERLPLIQSRIQNLEDSLRRLTIWPLIESGEFSSIADVGETEKDYGNDEGTIIEKLEAATDKLPAGLRNIARQGYIARDTALFRALQKSVQYSDFVMKAIYYDHVLEHEREFLEESPGYQEALDEAVKERNGLLSPDAMKAAREAVAKGRITEEFNNYDVPTGRSRGYVESIGLAWFLNYKIRAAKIGLSMLRNNPLDLLLYGTMPHPMAGGIPFTDNMFARLFEGSLGNALGPGMITQPIAWNSWYNLFGD